MGIRNEIGLKKTFSFLYKAGEINIENCKMKKGNELRNEANNEIFKYEINTSGNPVKIILFSSLSENRLYNGLDKILLIISALKKKKIKQTSMNKKQKINLFLNSLIWSK